MHTTRTIADTRAKKLAKITGKEGFMVHYNTEKAIPMATPQKHPTKTSAGL